MGRRDEEHTVEMEAYRRLARQSEMALVNRIEGAAENRQFQDAPAG
jgi:hypothetical protein